MNDLTEVQQELIQRYHDGACNWFEKRAAQKLIADKPAAAEFYLALQNIRQCCKTSLVAAPAALWAKIDQRIQQEEHAAIFLGERRVHTHAEKPTRAWLHSFWVRGGAGAVAMACAVFGMSNYLRSPAADSSAAGGVVQVSQETQKNYGRPQIIERRVPQIFEVDWMHSSRGRVQVLQDPDEENSILWIKKRRPQRFTPPQRLFIPPSGN